MDIREIQNLIKFVAKSGATEVKLEMDDFKITIKTTADGTESTTTYVQHMPMAAAPQVVAPQVVANAAAPAAPAAELPAIPEHFSSTLQHFSAELSALRTERDTLKAELATNATNYASQLAAKDAKIETLKQQIPAEGYKARPMATGNEDGKRILF